MTISMTKRYSVVGCSQEGGVVAIVYVPSHITDVEAYLRRIERRGIDGELFKPWENMETITISEVE